MTPEEPAASATPDGVTAAGTDLDEDFFIYSYNVSIPAGETRYLMVFWSLYATTGEGVAAGPAWNTNPATSSELLAGLPPLAQIVNWVFVVEPTFTG